MSQVTAEGVPSHTWYGSTSNRVIVGAQPDTPSKKPTAEQRRTLLLCLRLLERPAPESGTLGHVDGAQGRGDRLRRSFMPPILILRGPPAELRPPAQSAGPPQETVLRGGT